MNFYNITHSPYFARVPSFQFQIMDIAKTIVRET